MKLSKNINPYNSSELEYYPLANIGERFPENNPERKPRLIPRPKDEALFLHGLLEGMAKIEKNSYEAIHQLGGTFLQNNLKELMQVIQVNSLKE